MTTKSSTRRTNVTGLNARELHARNWHCQNLSKVAISASTFATAEGGRVSGFYSGSKSPFAAQTKAQDRRCAEMQSMAFGSRS